MLAELYAPRFLVVLNKIDLVSTDHRKEIINSLTIRVTKILEKTNAEYVDFVEFSTVSNSDYYRSSLTSKLKDLIGMCPARTCFGKPLLVVSDHCFLIKGKGTVITGTILQGSLKIGDSVQIISKGNADIRKIKSIQIFKNTAQSASTV